MTLIPIGLNKKPLITWRAPRAASHETTSPTFAPGARQWRGRAPLWARVIPEGAVVLDLDDGRGPPADWPATAELWTPRGVHLWYGSALRFTKRAVMIGGRRVDVCPAGTLEIVSGPGRWFVNVAIAELPGWLGDALGHHRTGGTTAGDTAHEGGSSLGSSRRGAPPLTQEPKPSFADLLNMKLDDIERPPRRLRSRRDGSPFLAGCQDARGPAHHRAQPSGLSLRRAGRTVRQGRRDAYASSDPLWSRHGRWNGYPGGYPLRLRRWLDRGWQITCDGALVAPET